MTSTPGRPGRSIAEAIERSPRRNRDLIHLSGNLISCCLNGYARVDSTDFGAEKGMVSLLLTRRSFGSSTLVFGGFFGVALILMPNGVPDSAKPWPARSLPAALPQRVLARRRKLLIAVPAAVETDPQR